MKTRNIIIILLAIFASSCTSPKYLKSSEEIDVSEYGSHIKIVRHSSATIQGELIAIDNDKITVLASSDNSCATVPVGDIKKFKLRYAKPKHYGWTIPVLTLSTISHGWWLLITAPLNLIVTISVTVGGENAFTYKGNDISYLDLGMFSRFPQGIPENVALEDIEHTIPEAK